MFLIQLTNREFLQSKPENVDELDNCHVAIAYTLCNQIIAEPLSFHVKLYTKLLGNLYISMDSVTRLRELKALSQQMNEKRMREAAEKALNDEQAVIWKKDKENYELEERRLQDKINAINKDNQSFL